MNIVGHGTLLRMGGHFMLVVGLVSREEKLLWSFAQMQQNFRGNTLSVGSCGIGHCSVTNLLSSLCHSPINTSIGSCVPSGGCGGFDLDFI
jgi:hypothetical protein